MVAGLVVFLWGARNRPTDGSLSAAGSESMTVGFWNAARTEHPIEPLVEWLGGSDLDVLALVEAPPLSAANES